MILFRTIIHKLDNVTNNYVIINFHPHYFSQDFLALVFFLSFELTYYSKQTRIYFQTDDSNYVQKYFSKRKIKFNGKHILQVIFQKKIYREYEKALLISAN